MEKNRESLQFKTNINCSGCVASVKPYLDNTEGICSWQVDTTGKDKLLIVSTEGITREKVMQVVQKAGFKIESIN